VTAHFANGNGISNKELQANFCTKFIKWKKINCNREEWTKYACFFCGSSLKKEGTIRSNWWRSILSFCSAIPCGSAW